jgi:hypothetical protein
MVGSGVPHADPYGRDAGTGWTQETLARWLIFMIVLCTCL